MRRIHAHVSLAAILVAAFASCLGCTMVGDRFTGVQVESQRPNECVLDCNQAFVEQMKAETRKLQDALEACRQSSAEDRKACHEAALAAFHAAVTGLHQDRKDCVNNCHRQGSGSGG